MVPRRLPAASPQAAISNTVRVLWAPLCAPLPVPNKGTALGCNLPGAGMCLGRGNVGIPTCPSLQAHPGLPYLPLAGGLACVPDACPPLVEHPPSRSLEPVPCCPYRLCVSFSLSLQTRVNLVISVGYSRCVQDANPNPCPCPGLCQRQTDRSDAQLTSKISLMAKCTQTPRQPGIPIAQRSQGVLV